jgi:hypothetical protein
MAHTKPIANVYGREGEGNKEKKNQLKSSPFGDAAEKTKTGECIRTAQMDAAAICPAWTVKLLLK